MSTPRQSSSPDHPSAFAAPTWAVLALIVVAACVAYWPALTGDFVWDDNTLVTESPVVKDPAGLYAIWFTKTAVDYWPVSNSSFWLEWRLWGMNPVGYHITNLLLHIAASVLVWVVLRRLSILGGALAALLFAVHPVNVEAVAWIAQRKTVLALVFFLLSILCYLKADSPGANAEQRLYAPGRGRWYWLSLMTFTLGMLSKGSIAFLPLVLPLLAWWQRGRVTRWDLARTVPFLLVDIPLVLVNIWFQNHGSGEVVRSAGFLERLLGAAAAVWFYLGKALLPINLMFVYPQWKIDTSNVLWWCLLLAAIAVTVGLWWQRASRFGRPLFFAWAFFCLALVPVLGFTDVYFMTFSLVADHYQNIALVAVVALVAAAWDVWYRRAQSLALVTAGIVVSALVMFSSRQAAMYENVTTLWNTTLERNPDCWLAHNNLGVMLYKENQAQQAIHHLEEAVRLEPNFHEAQSNLGAALLNAGHPQESTKYFQEALRLKPDFPEARYNLGLALAQMNHAQEAVEEYKQALRLDPDYIEVWDDLVSASIRAGRSAETMAAAQEALDRARKRENTALANKLEQLLPVLNAAAGRSGSTVPRSTLPPTTP